MRKVLVCTGNQAERGLLEPVCKRIREHPQLKLIKVDFSPIAVSFTGVYDRMTHLIQTRKPDIVLIPCDRKEALAMAIAAFHSNSFTAHFDAGEINTGSPDDITRLCISRLSHLLLCNTEKAKNNLVKLGEEARRIYTVGFTCVDDIDPTSKPVLLAKYRLPEEFDVLLLHPNSYSRSKTLEDIATASALINKATAIFYPNNDLYSEEIVDWVKSFKGSDIVRVLERVPRDDFLGMLKHCHRFIGNSSSACYEASFFGTDCVQVGFRNADRDRLKPASGASDKIVDVLSSCDLDEKTLKKEVVFCALG